MSPRPSLFANIRVGHIHLRQKGDQYGMGSHTLNQELQCGMIYGASESVVSMLWSFPPVQMCVECYSSRGCEGISWSFYKEDTRSEVSQYKVVLSTGVMRPFDPKSAAVKRAGAWWCGTGVGSDLLHWQPDEVTALSDSALFLAGGLELAR